MNLPSSEHDNLQTSQRVLAALREARARLEAAERVRTEPIAIVGVGCRFPGSDGPQAFWELLRDGVDAIREMPADRLAIDNFINGRRSGEEQDLPRQGAFLEDIDRFDAEFFGISPREAVSLDPQQRLLLEVCWEALEHAGQAPDRLAGSRTGVFVGLSQNDYALLQLQQRDPEDIDFYVGTGGGLCYGPGRVSHVLGLRGPNMALDTACSSSLLSVHLACQSLRLGECDLALAGGVQLALSRHLWDLLATSGALSPDGRCKAFDAAADGFGRGEGCGVVVLRRLSDALDHRDHILAVIRGSAINHDGTSSGLTVPNEQSQEDLLRRALAAARLEPAAIDYVEAHGTGTLLGDPIEVGALGSVFGDGRSPDQPLLLGSVKSNIGHLEAAAGIAGLIKVVLSLEHGQIPRHLHVHAPTAEIPWDDLPLSVVAAPAPWRRGPRARIAGVSSFGMSGANAHVLLEEAPLSEMAASTTVQPQLLAVSARTPPALLQSAARLETWLSKNSDCRLADVAFTTTAGRAHFEARASLVADSPITARRKLASLASGTSPAAKCDPEHPPRIAMLFTGQGAQYTRMGWRLFETQPCFRSIIQRCDKIFRESSSISLLNVLNPAGHEQELVHQTIYTQPAMFAIEAALAELLRGWGIVPAAVMGHSLGEYVAAVIAGVFSLEDGFRLVAERARLMQEIREPGEMAVVFTDYQRVRQAVEPLAGDVAIAAVNGPRNVVISGRPAAVRTLLSRFECEQTPTRRLNVSQAFHSPVIAPAVASLESFAAKLQFATPVVDIVSNVTGQLATTDIAQPRYWSEHARSPVQFASGVTGLYERGYRTFVECGPRQTLCGLASQCLPGDAVLLPCLAGESDDGRQLLETVGRLYEQGVEVDFEAIHRDSAARRVALPTYPFQRERYWFEPAAKNEAVTSDSTTHGDNPVDPALDACQYELNWQLHRRADEGAAPNLEAQAPAALGRWLVFADRTGVASRLREILPAGGQRCLLVSPGEQFRRLSECEWTVNPTQAGDFRQLLNECQTDSGGPLRILHLWSLDAPAADALNALRVEEAQQFGFASVLLLTQTLANQATAPPMWLVTRQAVALPGDAAPAAGLAQAPLWGLGKVLALEHPDLWGGLIDLPPSVDDRTLRMMVDQVRASTDEDQIAIRNHNYYVARIRRRENVDIVPRPIRADGSYLISGGLGALGQRVAQWLVEQGARQLVLIGRRPPNAETEESLDALRQAGAEILVAGADVTSEQEMADVFQQIQSTLLPLRGVVHAAGAFGYDALAELDWETASGVLKPKVTGAWILHQATRDLELDFFVGFSSLASLWGSKGQAHYAAANGFLDALAHLRVGAGLPGTSVNWGPWAGGGMATDEGIALLERTGVTAFAPDQATPLFAAALGAGGTQTALADIDWGVFKALFEAKRRRPLLDGLPSVADEHSEPQNGARTGLPRRWQGLDAGQRRRELLGWIQQEVAAVLRLADGKLPEPDKGFFKQGMDSLMAVELAKRLQRQLGLPLPTTLAFDFPNVRQLAEHLEGELQFESNDRSELDQSPAMESATALEDRDVDTGGEAVDRLLVEKLARLESLIGKS